MGSIAARQTFWTQYESVKFLDWIQSDGSGYVDTGFVVPNYLTEIIVKASHTNIPTWLNPLVFAGSSEAINASDLKPAFGFASVSPYNDRQLYIRCGTSRYWNATTNSGNWNDGQLHDIRIRMTSATAATALLDGTTISMTREGQHTDVTLPTDSQTIFASKYNGSYYMTNAVYKVRRVAYVLNGGMLADFRAASVNGHYGFYDILNKTFSPGEGGTFTAGDEIDPPMMNSLQTTIKFANGDTVALAAEGQLCADHFQSTGYRSSTAWVYQPIELTVGSYISSVAAASFSNCKQLSSVVFPETLIAVYGGAFSQCKLGNLTIPQSCHTIGINAFASNKLSNLTVQSKNIDIFYDDAFIDNLSLLTASFPNMTITDVTAATVWPFGLAYYYDPVAVIPEDPVTVIAKDQSIQLTSWTGRIPEPS